MTAFGQDAPTDEALLVSSLADPERFAGVFDRHAGAIHGYVARRLGADVAPDVVADIFLTAFRIRGRFDPDRGPVRPWLYGIATKEIGDHRRHEARRIRALARVPPPDADVPFEERAAERLGAQRLLPRLLGTLRRMSRTDRDLLLLVAWADLSYDEVAQALGIPIGTVRSRLHRLRGKLRTALGEEAHG